MLNFELFVKPVSVHQPELRTCHQTIHFQNKYVMTAGSVAIASCFGYMYYMRVQARKSGGGETYIALTETGEEVLAPKKSKWD